MIRLALALSLLLATPALAQQQAAPDRIANQIGTFFIQVQQQQDTITMLQAELTKALARIKELEAKDKPPEEKH